MTHPDFSQKLTAVAPLLPFYQFYEPVKAIILDEGRLSNLSLELAYLLTIGVATLSISYLLIKIRWLM